jgi:hypothetical protein
VLAPTTLQPLEGEPDIDELERLKTAVLLLIGTEAMIAMRDVLGLDHEEARTRGEWAVRQMVRSPCRRPTDRDTGETLTARSGETVR